VIDGMNEEQLRRVVLAIERETIPAPAGRDQTDLSRFEGTLQLRESPSAFQDRIRSEWD
jgi:hypothetical protein